MNDDIISACADLAERLAGIEWQLIKLGLLPTPGTEHSTTE